MEKGKVLELKQETLPMVSPLNIRTRGASGQVWGQRDLPGAREPSQGPTIFRPMYSQPGRTDSRKAFLWAPSENRAWPQGEDRPASPMQSLCLSLPVSLWVQVSLSV